MEKENFDEELKNRIKQVFEEYDDGAANKGWDLLREKYPEKTRRKYFFWWLSSVLALLLIAFTFWLLRPDFHQLKITKAVRPQATDSAAALADRGSSAKKSVSNKVFLDTNLTQKTSVKTASGFIAKHSAAKNNSSKQSFTDDVVNTKKTSVKTVSGFISKQALSNEAQAAVAISKQELQAKPEADNQKNASFTGKKSISDSIFTQTKTPVSVLTDSSKQKTLAAAAKKTSLTVVKLSVVKKTFEKTSFFSLGFYVGPHFNYASGSNNQLGLGAGISTDFRLTKKLKLSTGLGLMQNNLTYAQTIPSGSLYAASSNYTTAVPSSAVIIQTPSLSGMNAHLIALDIPVNLTYTFLPGKNSIAVSAGISSNTFVKEAYDYHYSDLTSSTHTIKSFNNFDFAKTLNLSAGFAYPFGKNKLQIEPFLKYPLGGTGSQQLKFGSAGINLKMNLRSLKK